MEELLEVHWEEFNGAWEKLQTGFLSLNGFAFGVIYILSDLAKMRKHFKSMPLHADLGMN